MPAQAPSAHEKPSFRLRVEADQPISSEDVGSLKRSWPWKIGFGIACLALIGVSAWVAFPHASLSDAAESSRHTPMVAFSPLAMPALKPQVPALRLGGESANSRPRAKVPALSTSRTTGLFQPYRSGTHRSGIITNAHSTEVDTAKAAELEKNPIFLDEAAMIEAKPFVIPPRQLILIAKNFLASDNGLGPDPNLLSDENFQFSSPKVGPLSKKQLVTALAQQAVNPLSKGFPDLKPEFYDFSVDPFEPNRVWYTSRGRGTNTAAFPPFAPEPTGKELIYPPQACSLTFDKDGLITKYTIAAVMDRFEGNTGGLGGLFGALYAMGMQPRVRKRDILKSKIGSLWSQLTSSAATAPAPVAAMASTLPKEGLTISAETLKQLEAEPYYDQSAVPVNTYKPKEPYMGKVVSVERIVGAGATGETMNIVIDHDGKMPYWEGQSFGVVPPGVNPKNGKPNSVRLYSIASSRYGDDMSGKTTTLCVRRATYWDPELKADDPAKKGVCSNFLCDAKPGDEVALTGPSGKVMLLPEDKPETDIIMVATGTGIAPYRSFWKRLFIENTPAAAAYKGQMWLFMGAANKDATLYDDELQMIKEKNPEQFRLDYALSREQKNKNGDKMYIQDKVEEYSEEVFAKMDAGAHMYFCGLKGMMPGILTMLEKVATAKGLVWTDVLDGWKKNKQWHVEVY